MRKLATFAYTFALGTALYQYLRTPQTILWGIPPVLALLLAGTLGRRLWRRRLWIMAWAMAAGLVWSGAYDLWISGPIRAWAGQNLLVTAEVTDYCQLTGSGSRRIPVRLAGEGGPRCAALWYGDEALEALAPGDIVTAQVFLQDAGEIRGESLRTFTAKGVLLLDRKSVV